MVLNPQPASSTWRLGHSTTTRPHLVQIPITGKVKYVYPTSSKLMNFNPELPPLSCSISINIAPFATTGGCICISISLWTINNLQTWMDTLSSFLSMVFPPWLFSITSTSWVPNFCGPYLGQKCISIYIWWFVSNHYINRNRSRGLIGDFGHFPHCY
jgi:hypothetical protein